MNIAGSQELTTIYRWPVTSAFAKNGAACSDRPRRCTCSSTAPAGCRQGARASFAANAAPSCFGIGNATTVLVSSTSLPTPAMLGVHRGHVSLKRLELSRPIFDVGSDSRHVRLTVQGTNALGLRQSPPRRPAATGAASRADQPAGERGMYDWRQCRRLVLLSTGGSGSAAQSAASWPRLRPAL